MDIKVGEFDVLKNGTVIGNNNEYIDFILDQNSQFTLRMSFEDDEINKESSLKAELFGINGLQIFFKNFNNSLGTGNVTPIKVGSTLGRELFINYRIYSQKDSGKLVHYTFLLGKEVKDGK